MLTALSSLNIVLAALCTATLVGPACTGTGGQIDANVTKETPATTREFTQEELAEFLHTLSFDVEGGTVSSRYIDLDGVAPRELLVEVRCAPEICSGDVHMSQGSSYFVYSLSDSLEHPHLLRTPHPVTTGADGQAELADLDGDGIQELIVSGHDREGQHRLALYSMRDKVLSTRFEGPLRNVLSHLVMDLDGDGSAELITLHYEVGDTSSGGIVPEPDLLDSIAVQVWMPSSGRLEPKPISAQDGLRRTFEAALADPDADVMELARLMIVMRHAGQQYDPPRSWLTRLMKAYDARVEAQPLGTLSVPSEPHANERSLEGSALSASPELYILLSALKLPNQDAVATWSVAHCARARTPDELAAHVELILETSSLARRDRLATDALHAAFDVMLAQGPGSNELYDLTFYVPAPEQGMAVLQRQFFIASLLLHPNLTFAGREEAIRQFIQRSMDAPMATYPFAGVLVPELINMDLSSMSSDYIFYFITQLLPEYVRVTRAHHGNGLNEDQQHKLAASLERIIVTYPELQHEVSYLVSTYLQEPSFAPLIASVMGALHERFVRGRATQADRDDFYQMYLLWPLALPGLSKAASQWWAASIYRQGMGENLDAELIGRCDASASRNEDQIELLLSSMEALPRESRVMDMCLPYMLEMYEEDAQVNAARQARLHALIVTVLQSEDDESRLQEMIAMLSEYPRLVELAPSLWRIVKRRKSTFDTARYQALVMLGKHGDHEAMKELRKTSEAIFLDPKLRDKDAHVGDPFYIEALARQRSLDLLVLMFELAEDDRLAPERCVAWRDVLERQARTSEFTSAQQTRWETLCGGSSE